MAQITAQMVKDLREMTGAGMMDCKAALGEASGNIDDPLLSRRHVAFRVAGEDEIIVEDLESRNGTYVDGERIKGRVTVGTGATIRAGSA